jgi:hypothetical protein
MGLCVKNNKSQYLGVLGYPVVRETVRDARAWGGEFALYKNYNANQRPTAINTTDCTRNYPFGFFEWFLYPP